MDRESTLAIVRCIEAKKAEVPVCKCFHPIGSSRCRGKCSAERELISALESAITGQEGSERERLAKAVIQKITEYSSDPQSMEVMNALRLFGWE